jgi:DNA-binding Lrp family transcriptional regulator
MDDIDRALIRHLSADARATTTALAHGLGLARSTVQSRIERLEARGIITGYTLRLAEEDERRQIKTHVMIAVAPKQAGGVVAALTKMPNLTSLYAISGEYDLIAIVTAPTTEGIDETIDAIGALGGVARTNSSVVLSTKFER